MVRCTPFRWLWGLIPLAFVAFLVIVGTRDVVQRDLRERAQSLLGKAGFFWALPHFNGRDGTISGTAVSETERRKAVDLARRVWGVRTVDDHATLLDKIDPYIWQISRKRDRLRLKGYVPSEEDHKIILGMVRANFPSGNIDDQLQLGRGAPAREAWLGGISFILKQVGSLNRGVAALKGTEIIIRGTAENSSGYDTVMKAVSNELPAGLKIKGAEIIPPKAEPYTWSVSLGNSGLTIDGHVPALEEKQRIHNLIKEKFKDVMIVDRTRLASGVPSQWSHVVELSLAHLSRLEDGNVNISELTLEFTGTATDLATRNDVEGSFKKALPSGYSSNVKIAFRTPPKPVLPRIDPYIFSAEQSNGVLQLSGFVPSERVRASLLAIARATLPHLRIVDKLQLGLGRPSEDNWLNGIGFGLLQLANMEFGSFRLKENEFSIGGEASSVPKFLSAQARLRTAFPDGFILLKNGIVAPRVVPFVSGAEYNSKLLVLTGYVPAESDRKKLLAFAGKRFPNASVVDRMTLASGAPENWLVATRVGLVQLSYLVKGNLIAEDEAIKIEGRAKSESIRSKIKEIGISRLPENYSRAESIEVVRAPEVKPVKKVTADLCQELINSQLSQGVIEFKTASSELQPRSIPVLNALADVANRCPETTIEIAGYTDSDGSKEFNRYLSQRRAEAVVKFLEDAGVAVGRLNAVGYGEERPKAPNDTAHNKARNRRIEFIIKG